MRLIDADETIHNIMETYCDDCYRRKGTKNGKIQFCYEIGDAPCRACEIGDVIDYIALMPTVEAIPLEWIMKWSSKRYRETHRDVSIVDVLEAWQKEQEAR